MKVTNTRDGGKWSITKGWIMPIDQKLEMILNNAYPKESGIKLTVTCLFKNKGYIVQMYENNNKIDSFYLSQNDAEFIIKDK